MNNYYELELEKVEKECQLYKYRAFLVFDQIHIQTKFEKWYFIPHENGCIKLMHSNCISAYENKYHKQFSRKMNYRQLVTYIHEHETAKYTNQTIRFTFTKTGAIKPI